MRRASLIAILLTGVLLSACGSDEAPKPAAGTPGNPLVAQPAPEDYVDPDTGKAANATPGYKALLDSQSKKPRSRFTPCNLVTKCQARAILGVPVQEPIEAPQGPTCIYQGVGGKGFTTVAVQSVGFDDMLQQVRRRERMDVAGQRAYCGTVGQPTLVVRLAARSVLTVSAPCPVAQKFAETALRQL